MRYPHYIRLKTTGLLLMALLPITLLAESPATSPEAKAVAKPANSSDGISPASSTTVVLTNTWQGSPTPLDGVRIFHLARMIENADLTRHILHTTTDEQRAFVEARASLQEARSAFRKVVTNAFGSGIDTQYFKLPLAYNLDGAEIYMQQIASMSSIKSQTDDTAVVMIGSAETHLVKINDDWLISLDGQELPEIAPVRREINAYKIVSAEITEGKHISPPSIRERLQELINPAPTATEGLATESSLTTEPAKSDTDADPVVPASSVTAPVTPEPIAPGVAPKTQD